MKKKLSRAYYLDEDVTAVSRDLLGKTLVTRFDGRLTSGIIVETEAYRGPEDKASHAYGGRRTPRTEIMFAQGGTAYVYMCYGMHHLFNVVTNRRDIPHAVLIRAVQPLEGVHVMSERRKLPEATYRLTAGPGSLSKALGITKAHTGVDLLGDVIWLEDRGISFSEKETVSSKRIGVEYAGAHAKRLWRFFVKGNPWVSG